MLVIVLLDVLKVLVFGGLELLGFLVEEMKVYEILKYFFVIGVGYVNEMVNCL